MTNIAVNRSRELIRTATLEGDTDRNLLQAIRTLRSTLEGNYDDPDVWRAGGEAFAKLDQLMAASGRAPASEPLARFPEVKRAVDLARQYERNGDGLGALKILRNAILQHPESPHLWRAGGDIVAKLEAQNAHPMGRVPPAGERERATGERGAHVPLPSVDLGGSPQVIRGPTVELKKLQDGALKLVLSPVIEVLPGDFQKPRGSTAILVEVGTAEVASTMGGKRGKARNELSVAGKKVSFTTEAGMSPAKVNDVLGAALDKAGFSALFQPQRGAPVATTAVYISPKG